MKTPDDARTAEDLLADLGALLADLMRSGLAQLAPRDRAAALAAIQAGAKVIVHVQLMPTYKITVNLHDADDRRLELFGLEPRDAAWH